MKGIKVLLLGAVFCAAVAPYVYAWSGVQNRICSHADVGNSPVEMITFEQSGIRIVSSGTIPTELSNSRFGIPVSTATWEESLSGYKTYPGKIEYQKHSVLNFYNANGKRIKAVKKAEIIARMHKKAGAETTVSLPEFSVNISTAGYVAFEGHR